MANPTRKNPKIDEAITKLTGIDRKESVRIQRCPFCDSIWTLESFRDTKSQKEAMISGLCQSCQDKMFGV